MTNYKMLFVVPEHQFVYQHFDSPHVLKEKGHTGFILVAVGSFAQCHRNDHSIDGAFRNYCTLSRYGWGPEIGRRKNSEIKSINLNMHPLICVYTDMFPLFSIHLFIDTCVYVSKKCLCENFSVK